MGFRREGLFGLHRVLDRCLLATHFGKEKVNKLIVIGCVPSTSSQRSTQPSLFPFLCYSSPNLLTQASDSPSGISWCTLFFSLVLAPGAHPPPSRRRILRATVSKTGLFLRPRVPHFTVRLIFKGIPPGSPGVGCWV